jgi:hypothetical protein
VVVVVVISVMLKPWPVFFLGSSQYSSLRGAKDSIVYLSMVVTSALICWKVEKMFLKALNKSLSAHVSFMINLLLIFLIL